jgi:ribosomal protein S18 acetylase RimI-like enzyme
MELPVAPQTYLPSADKLVRAIKRLHRILARVVADEHDLDGAKVFACAEYPQAPAVNFAGELVLPDPADADAVDALIDRAIDQFQQAGSAESQCLAMYAAALDWPPALADAITRRGFVAQERQVLLLAKYAAPTNLNQSLQIIPGRAAYREIKEILHTQHAESLASESASLNSASIDAATEVGIGFLDESRLDVFLGRIDRKPVGYASVLSLGNMGVIHEVYVDAGHRRKGVGLTLINAVLEHCQRALFEQVIVEVEPDDGRGPLFDSVGFNRVASYTAMVRQSSTAD